MFDKEKMWIGGEGYQMLDEDGCAWRLGSFANFIDHGTVEETLNSQYLSMYICHGNYIYISTREGLKCDSKKWSGSGGASTIQKQFSFPWFTSPKFCSQIKFWIPPELTWSVHSEPYYWLPINVLQPSPAGILGIVIGWHACIQLHG